MKKSALPMQAIHDGASAAERNTPSVSMMGCEGKEMKTLIILFRDGASKQLSGFFQVLVNEKCSLHISCFQQKGLILLCFIYYYFQ